jgi:hypothetical protein
MSVFVATLALTTFQHLAVASTDGGASALFNRHCDMICDRVSDWYDSLGAAQTSCAESDACAAVVDHSATQGKFGLCSTSSIISKGSDKSETLRVVCVEHKSARGNAVALLQTSAGASSAVNDGAIAKMFTRQCDMMCDGASDWHGSMYTAQRSCAGNQDCVGIVDHSINRGRFGLCMSGATFTKGSSKSEAFRRVCVERKHA